MLLVYHLTKNIYFLLHKRARAHTRTHYESQCFMDINRRQFYW